MTLIDGAGSPKRPLLDGVPSPLDPLGNGAPTVITVARRYGAAEGNPRVRTANAAGS
jgi:hypothetical protein